MTDQFVISEVAYLLYAFYEDQVYELLLSSNDSFSNPPING